MFKLICLDCFAKGVPERLDSLTKKRILGRFLYQTRRFERDFTGLGRFCRPMILSWMMLKQSETFFWVVSLLCHHLDPATGCQIMDANFCCAFIHSHRIHVWYIYPQAPSFATDKIPHRPALLTHLQPRSSNGSELYSCLASGSRDRCCAGNILVESSSPQPQDNNNNNNNNNYYYYYYYY